MNDKTIEIRCGECFAYDVEHYETGVQAMYEHILYEHPNYNQHEADVFALEWMEAAYDRHDQEEDAYNRDHQYERKLNALRGKE